VSFRLRIAVPCDIPALRRLIEVSVLGLQADDYNPAQLSAALKTVYGVDSQLIADGTYFAVEHVSEQARGEFAGPIVGCGGWSKRKTLYGGDQWTERQDSLLDPSRDAAKIRAFFVHPEWARRGIGSLILNACEAAALTAGFTRLEMGATLTGIPFYRSKGYVPVENADVPMGEGLSLPIVKMAKRV
jgi:GNAT superfamily N-acetyltransferase